MTRLVRSLFVAFGPGVDEGVRSETMRARTSIPNHAMGQLSGEHLLDSNEQAREVKTLLNMSFETLKLLLRPKFLRTFGSEFSSS